MTNLTITSLIATLIFLASNIFAQTKLPEVQIQGVEYSLFWGLIRSEGYAESDTKIIKSQPQIERQSKNKRQLNISKDEKLVSILGGTIQWTRKKKYKKEENNE